jgi:ATP:ADP antiporter, AAA family
MASASPETQSAGRLARVLKAVVVVRDDEVGVLAWSFLDLFSLLAGNYVIRPLRDEMGVAGGTKNLPGMFLATLGAMLAVGLLFSAVCRRWGRPSLPVLYRFLQANLLLFFVLPRVLPAWTTPAMARAFFVWASVYNLFVVSVVWGAMASRFRAEQARRLFGFLAAGGTLGAIVGSSLAATLAARVGPANLLILTIAFLELGLFAARRAGATVTARREPEPSFDPEPARQSPYVFGLALNVLCFTITSACVYLEQARIVAAAFADPADRTSLFARIDLLVNLVGLAVQMLLTGRIIALLGVGGASATLPLVTLAGFIALWTRPTLGVLVLFQVARRSVDYAVARPCREVMYAATKPGGKLGTRTLIDTAVYRAGDALGAWAYGLFALLPGPFGTAMLIVPLTVAWIGLNLGLGRRSPRG